MLARALWRVVSCRRALGVTAPLVILRAQDDAGGSRYELGLGVDMQRPPAAELDQLAQALTSNNVSASATPETRALLASMSALSSGADPDGAWLLRPCG